MSLTPFNPPYNAWGDGVTGHAAAFAAAMDGTSPEQSGPQGRAGRDRRQRTRMLLRKYLKQQRRHRPEHDEMIIMNTWDNRNNQVTESTTRDWSLLIGRPRKMPTTTTSRSGARSRWFISLTGATLTGSRLTQK